MSKEKLLFCKLTSLQKKIALENPHSTQFFCHIKNIFNYKPNNYETNYYKYIKKVKENAIDNIPEKNIYEKELKETLDLIKPIEYNPRGLRPSTTLHLGQLKLFLSTFQFLLRYAIKDTIVIYPGSAQGYNIEFLTELFPDIKWYLFDPNRYYENLYSNKKVIIKNTLFEDNDVNELAIKLKNKYILLLSDIRVNNPTEEMIDYDNKLHIKWIEKLKPNYAQLKFRIPRLINNKKYIDKYKYFDGKIFLQYYAAHASTETRLVVNGKNIKYKDYSLSDYENRLYHFNRSYRCSIYPNKIKIKCLDNCYDCYGFTLLCEEYLKKYPKKYKLDEFIKLIIKKIPNVNIRLCKHYQTIINNLF